MYSRFEYLFCRASRAYVEIQKVSNKIERTQSMAAKVPKSELLFETINPYSFANKALVMGLPKVTVSDSRFSYSLDFQSKKMQVMENGKVKETVVFYVLPMPQTWYGRNPDGSYTPLAPFNQLKIWNALIELKPSVNLFMMETPEVIQKNANASKVIGVLQATVHSKIGELAIGNPKFEFNLTKKVQINPQDKVEHPIYTSSEVQNILAWDISVPYDENSTKIVELTVNKNSDEWNSISKVFYLTMPSKLKIVGVQKIVNPILRQNWEHELRMVKRKNNNADMQYVKLLWNGTGTTPPSAIYSNDKGWMVNYSTDGNLWGKGAYFSEDVSYVCGKKNNTLTYKYAHKTKQNTIKLFLAQVIVGDAIHLEETANLPQPPNKEGSDQKYDSVLGFRHNTFIYCVKDNGRAYPTYVVEFTQS